MAGTCLGPSEPLSASRVVSWGEDKAGAQILGNGRRPSLWLSKAHGRMFVVAAERAHIQFLPVPSKIEARPAGNF